MAPRVTTVHVLHVGNIANNSYHNARALLGTGIDNDVLVYDYYALSATPESEDRSLDLTSLDPAYPDLGPLLADRPDWFAQGPLLPAARYLLSKRVHGPGSAVAATARAAMEAAFTDVVRAKDPARHGLEYDELCRLAADFAPASERFVSSFAPWLVGRHDVDGHRFLHCFNGAYQRRIEEAIGWFAARFPDRPDQLVPDDLVGHVWSAFVLGLLLERYDAAILTATTPHLGALAGYERVVAYEHGTIRDIPFEPTTLGRLTTFGYAHAERIIVTNTDNLRRAEVLAGSAERVVRGFHGFDLSHRVDPPPAEPGSRVRFLAPARHQWCSGDLGMRKGNDLVVEALGRLDPAVRDRCEVILLRWGPDVAATEQLVTDRGVGGSVTWRPAMTHAAVIDLINSMTAVIDQFPPTAMGFGATGVEALSSGTAALITKVDLESVEAFFGEAPALYACSTPDELAAVLRALIDEPDRARRTAADARAFMERNHSLDALRANLVDTLRSLAADGPAPFAPLLRDRPVRWPRLADLGRVSLLDVELADPGDLAPGELDRLVLVLRDRVAGHLVARQCFVRAWSLDAVAVEHGPACTGPLDRYLATAVYGRPLDDDGLIVRNRGSVAFVDVDGITFSVEAPAGVLPRLQAWLTGHGQPAVAPAANTWRRRQGARRP